MFTKITQINTFETKVNLNQLYPPKILVRRNNKIFNLLRFINVFSTLKHFST